MEVLVKLEPPCLFIRLEILIRPILALSFFLGSFLMVFVKVTMALVSFFTKLISTGEDSSAYLSIFVNTLLNILRISSAFTFIVKFFVEKCLEF